MRFVHLQRRDLVAQAVSRHKAEVSGTWQLGIEEAGHPSEPFYDVAQINAYLHEAIADNAAWRAWFGVNGVLPVQLCYEDLAADPVAATRQVLRMLGLTVPAGCGIKAPNRRMADDISADWVRRFRAQMAPAG